MSSMVRTSPTVLRVTTLILSEGTTPTGHNVTFETSSFSSSYSTSGLYTESSSSTGGLGAYIASGLGIGSSESPSSSTAAVNVAIASSQAIQIGRTTSPGADDGRHTSSIANATGDSTIFATELSTVYATQTRTILKHGSFSLSSQRLNGDGANSSNIVGITAGPVGTGPVSSPVSSPWTAPANGSGTTSPMHHISKSCLHTRRVGLGLVL